MKTSSTSHLLLLVGLVCFCRSAMAEVSIYSSVVTETGDTQIISTIPDETVSTSLVRNVDRTYFNGVSTETFTISSASRAEANSDFGINRILVSGQKNTGLVPQVGGSFFTSSVANASAVSRWRDEWEVTGAPIGTNVDVQFFGTLNGSLIAPEDDLQRIFANGDPIILGLNYYFSNGGGTINSFSISGADILASLSASGDFSLPWSIVTSMPVGYVGQIESFFSADTRASNLACTGTCSETVTFSSMTSASLDRIVAPSGFGIRVSSGQLMQSDGAYVYLAASVPEPEIFVQLFAGLAVLGAVFARRRVKRCALADSNPTET